MPKKHGNKMISTVTIEAGLWEALRDLCLKCDLTWDQLFEAFGQIIAGYDQAMNSLPAGKELDNAIDVFLRILDRKEVELAKAITAESTLSDRIIHQRELLNNELHKS